MEGNSVAPMDSLSQLTNTAVDTPTLQSDHRGGDTSLGGQINVYTTSLDSYRTPRAQHQRQTGQREEMLQRFLYMKFSKEVMDELHSPPEDPTVKESTTKRDYRVDGFTPWTPAATKDHSYRTDQAVSFWLENTHRVTGVSDVRTRDTPFKKTSTFSTPITEYLDQPQPHGLQNYPDM